MNNAKLKKKVAEAKYFVLKSKNPFINAEKKGKK